MNRIGIDIGGTQLRVAAFSEDGTLLKKEVFPNDRERGPEENLAKLAAAIEGWGIDCAGIGIGIRDGRFDLSGFQITEPLAEELQHKILHGSHISGASGTAVHNAA